MTRIIVILAALFLLIPALCFGEGIVRETYEFSPDGTTVATTGPVTNTYITMTRPIYLGNKEGTYGLDLKFTNMAGHVDILQGSTGNTETFGKTSYTPTYFYTPIGDTSADYRLVDSWSSEKGVNGDGRRVYYPDTVYIPRNPFMAFRIVPTYLTCTYAAGGVTPSWRLKFHTYRRN